jgi:serralysin
LPGVYIENAVTGAAADEIVDNMVDNRLSCGAGDDLVSLLYGGFDRVDGGAGFDTVRIADTIADIEMTSQADGSILLLGTYFAASLTQVEQLLFADGTTLPLGA